MLSLLLQIFIGAALGLALYIPIKLKGAKLDPIAAPLPELPVFPNKLVNITGKVELIGQGTLVGPESIIPGEKYLFATLGDGRIARIQHDANQEAQWEFLAQTGPGQTCGFSPSDEASSEAKCGRPLGMKVVQRSTVDPEFSGSDEEEVLLVADAYQGILMVTNIYDQVNVVNVIPLATRATTDPKDYQFNLLNALIQMPDGSVYVTETTQVFERRRIFWAAMDGHATGRLLKYTKEGGVQVVLDNLFMPNGIVSSHDGEELLIVAGVKILRFSLKDQKLVDHFVSVLPGTGDNIDAMDHLPSGEPRKCYWAGLGSKFAQPFSLLKLVSEKPLLKKVLLALVPYKVLVDFIPKLSALAVYDEKGELIEIYKDDSAAAPWISEGELFGGYLYLGSWYNPYLARVKIDGLVSKS